MVITKRSYCLNCARFVHEEEDSHLVAFPGHALVNYEVDTDYYDTVLNSTGFKIGAPVSGTVTIDLPGFDTIEEGIAAAQSDIFTVSGGLVNSILVASGILDSLISQNAADVAAISGSAAFGVDLTTLSGALQSSIDGKVSLTGDEVVQGVKTFDNDVYFRGNLAVSGTNTIINTTELQVEDALITLAFNQEGTPLLNAGIEVERGDSANASFLWDESLNRWSAGIQGSEDLVALFPELLSSSGSLQTQINTAQSDISINQANITLVQSDLSTSSGSLQTQVNINSSDISNLQSDVSTNLSLISAASGSLQAQVSSNDSDISTIQGDVSTLQSDTNLNTFNINVSSGVLQGQVDSNDSDISQLQSDLSAASGTLQADVDSRVLKAGDTMTGFLTLHADPTASGHAVTKQYVDSEITSLMSSISINQSFQDENGPGINTASTTYEAMNFLIFAGTDKVGTLAAIKAVIDVSDGSTTGQVRIYDSTNAQTIAESAIFADTAPTLLDLGTISNLPASEAIWELQLRKVSGGGSRNIRIYALNLEF